VTVGIGFNIFLFVIGAILTFAVEVDASGFNINTVGIILMVGGLLGLFASLLFWSSFSPWSRRRTVACDAVVEERRIEPDLPDAPNVLRPPASASYPARLGQDGSRTSTASRPTGLTQGQPDLAAAP
jgi:hypothetical protein